MTYHDTYTDLYGAAMAIPGCDYSYNPPTPAELKAAGMKFACRYLVGRAPKKLTATEVQALHQAGLAIVSNYESTKGFMLDGGFDKGVSVAKAAWATHKAVGGPDRRPIYFSADTDPGGWTPGQWASFDRFLDGAASVLGKQGVGVYGGTLALQAARAGGSCGWFWQALGWRNGVWLSWVHLQQYNNGEPLGSGEVDFDRALDADYGQWPTNQEEDMTIEELVKELTTSGSKTRIALRELARLGSQDTLRTAVAGDKEKAAGPYFEGLARDLAALQTTVEAGIKVSIDPQQLTPDQLAMIGEVFAGKVVITGVQAKAGQFVVIFEPAA